MFAAEASAAIGHNKLHVVRGDGKSRSEFAAHVERPLCRRPDDEPAASPLRSGRARFHWRVLDIRYRVGFADHAGRGCQRSVHIAFLT